MPLVLLNYKPGVNSKNVVRQLALKLPEMIAFGLDVTTRGTGEGRVTNEDVIVRCSEVGKHDVNSMDIEIIVIAHDFPARSANLEERKEAILEEVHSFFRSHEMVVTGYVQIFLQPVAAFGLLRPHLVAKK